MFSRIKMFRRKSSGKKKTDSLTSSNLSLDDVSESSTVFEDNSSSYEESPKKTSEVLRELFTIHATPKINVRNELHDTISIIKEFFPTLTKFVEWSLMFLIGSLGWSYAWIICFLLTYHAYRVSKDSSVSKTRLSSQCSFSPEKDVFQSSSSAVGIDSFPSWVSFPDFDRVEWMNVVMKKVWPHIGPVSNTVAKKIVEPQINKVLNRMNVKSVNLGTISNFKLKEFILGSTPARVGGIKAYDRNTDRDEVVVDVEVIYAGDARVKFSVQGFDCEINQINFRAMVRLVLKPLIEALPIVGGVEFFFVSMPSLDYNLGGMANVAEIPGISNIIRGILDKIIKKGFVWPNRLNLYLPLESLRNMEDKSFMLPAPSGVLSLQIIKGRDLVKKDLSGTSDPYVVASVGLNKVSFVEKYVARDCNPEWNYCTEFILEEPSGHKLELRVFDYDAGSEDDFMGEISLDVECLMEAGDQEQWLTLQNTKHGEILVRSHWSPVSSSPVIITSRQCLVSVFIDSFDNVSSSDKKSPPYTKTEVRVGNTKRNVWSSKVKGPGVSPSIKQGSIFLSTNPSTDSINISIEDSRSGQVLGKVSIQLSYLMKLPGSRINNMKWSLDTGLINNGEEESSVTLSAALIAF